MPVRKQFKYRVEARQRDAKLRQEYWDGLSEEKQLEALDLRLGVSMGATKQRARIVARIAQRDQPKPTPKKKDKAPRRRQRQPRKTVDEKLDDIVRTCWKALGQ